MKRKIYKEKTFDIHYFDKIDSREKAQVLGFIYADGCNKNGTTLCIALAEKDVEYLELIRQTINLSRPLKITKRAKDSEQNKCSLNIYSKYVSSQLVKLGVSPQKSLILNFPNENQVPIKLLPDFIRGYFEGDGCMYFYEKKKTGALVIAGSDNFCKSLKNYLYDNCIQSYIVKAGKIDILRISHGQIEKFYKLIYDNPPFYMVRKYNQFQYFLNNRITYEKSSKYKGVIFRKSRWIAQFPYVPIGVKRYIGSFSTELEAAIAVDNKLKEVLPNMRILNFPNL